MRVMNRILKSFYLFAVVCILSQMPCYANIPVSKEIPDGFGPLIACLLSVAVVMIKSYNLKIVQKESVK